MYTGQLAFIYEDKKYVTLFGANAYLMSAAQGLNNVAQANVIIASGGLSSAFTKLSGERVQNTPVIDCSEVTLEDNTFHVIGEVEIEGNTYSVMIDGDGITIDGMEGESEEDTEVTEEVVQTTPTVEQELESEVKEEETEESVSGVYFESKETQEYTPTGGVVSEKTVDETLQAMEDDEQVNPAGQEYSEVGEVKDLEQAMKFVNAGIGQTTVHHSQTNPEELLEGFTESVKSVQSNDEQPSPKTDRFNPFARFEGLPVPKRGGIALADKPLQEQPEFVVGGKTNNDSGIYWNSGNYESNYERVQRERLQAAYKSDLESKEFSSKDSYRPFTTEFNRMRRTSSREPKDFEKERAYLNPESVERKQVESSKSGVSEDSRRRGETNSELQGTLQVKPNNEAKVVPDTQKDSQKALKSMGFKGKSKVEETPKLDIKPTGKTRSEVEKGLSEEVVKALHEIPDTLLASSIVAFTTKPVDTVQLEKRGHMYCIDNRWHRNGQWNCIDVVEDATRHFYNSRTHLNIAIPFNVCKEWVNSTP